MLSPTPGLTCHKKKKHAAVSHVPHADKHCGSFNVQRSEQNMEIIHQSEHMIDFTWLHKAVAFN